VGGASPPPGRPHDSFGAGVFYYGYSGHLKRLLEPMVTLRDENRAEVFYNYAITPLKRMTANAQVLFPSIAACRDGPPVVQRLLKRIEDEPGMGDQRHPPADDPPGEGVDDEGDVDDALPSRDIG
jgi:hypothetical protein